MPTTSTHPPESFTFKEKLQYTLLGFVVVGGGFLLVRSLIRKAVSTSEEKKTFQQGNPAMYAQQIRMALENDGWPGKDLPALRHVIEVIASIAEFKKVINSYQRLFNRSLMGDLKKDLKTSEYNEMLAILAAKQAKGHTAGPVQLTLKQYISWATRLKAAFDKTYGIFPGTDEAAIKAVFDEIPSQYAFHQVGKVYNWLFHADFDHDLSHELEFWEYPSYMKIINDKPNV